MQEGEGGGGLMEAGEVGHRTAASCSRCARPDAAVLFSERQVAGDRGEAAGGLQLVAGE